MTTETRLEADSIGTMEVPAEAYYGVQALRAKQNFPITGTKLHPVFINMVMPKVWSIINVLHSAQTSVFSYLVTSL